MPVIYHSEGDITTLNPTLYTTIMAGKLLIDPRISYLAKLSEAGNSHQLSFGLTVGYVIDNVVLGLDAETGFDPENSTAEQLRDNLNYQGILRIDLYPQHNNWVQAYLGKEAIGIGFRSNFDWK